MKHNNQIKRNTLTRWQKPPHKKQKNEDDNFSSPEQPLVFGNDQEVKRRTDLFGRRKEEYEYS
jgi:hypothetical protein